MERYYKFRTQLVMARSVNVVRLGNDDYGVYTSGTGNGEFGTPLMARGTEREVVDFLVDVGVDFNLPR